MTPARRRRGHRTRYALVAIVVASALTACGQSRSTTAPTTLEGTVQLAATPSVSTRMICEPEAQKDLSATIGVATIKTPAPTWLMHTYTCAYVYTDGQFTLSVKQLPNAVDTRGYFAALGDRLKRRVVLTGLGQGAVTTADGSVIVQKDDKVLLVDVSRLPVRFGAPSDSRANVAISIAATIMGCWTGA